MKSKAMVLTGFRQPLEMQEFEIPALKEGQILIKLDAIGVCGSDVHMWKGEDPRTPLPIILGHEGVGTIVDMQGPKNSIYGEALKEGDKIIWHRGMNCNKCYACVILKDPSLCTNRRIYGINVPASEPPYLNGGYSEYIILDDSTHVFKIEEEVDPAILVSASCSGSTVAHAIDMSHMKFGDTVLVQGPGPLGVYAVAFAKSMGASEIIVIGGSEVRLELCKEFGATAVLNRHNLTIEERREKVLQLTRGRGVDIAIEAVGVQGAAEEGLKLVRTGGAYLSTGYAQPAGIEKVDFFLDVVRKNLRIQGVWVSDASHTEQAIKLVLKNKELFGKLVTHRMALEDANEALKVMDSKEALKAVLLP